MNKEERNKIIKDVEEKIYKTLEELNNKKYTTYGEKILIKDYINTLIQIYKYRLIESSEIEDV